MVAAPSSRPAIQDNQDDDKGMYLESQHVISMSAVQCSFETAKQLVPERV
jgi:hypothetical protein